MHTQQRFLAYAAHELRGQLALQLVLAEATLADPHADMPALREMGECVVASCRRQERLLEALLALCRSEHGHLRRDPVDLAAIAADALETREHDRLARATSLQPARTAGDPQLIERLVANLLDNAIRHNAPGGWLEIVTDTAAGRATFTIANTGPVVPSAELQRLFQPFQRLTAHAARPANGFGLGLAIVQAIANAHDATLTAHARTSGGLGIDVAFPALD
jgi:signal transduction histidine kinase